MLESIKFFIGLCVVLVLLYFVINSKKKINDKNLENNNAIKKQVNYVKKSLMTKIEISFYHILNKIDNNKYIVIPQVCLGSIIDKRDNKYRNELFKIVDFGIFERDSFTPLLLIELNDASHYRKDRKLRNSKVDNLCKESNIPLIKFYTNYPNKEDYVLGRVNDILNKQYSPSLSLEDKMVNNGDDDTTNHTNN